MRFSISTYARKNKCCQRLEVKTDSIFSAAEIIRFFLITSNSCRVKVWKPKNRSKIPDIIFSPEFYQYDEFLDSNFLIYLKNKMEFTIKL